MADTSVKMFSSEMSGAPSFSTADSMVDVMDACLVNGFGEVTLDSLTVSAGVATGSLSTGHGFTMYGATSAGPVISISGATPADLNGEWRLDSVADANTFTFAVSGIADATATGTITAKRAPAGWTIKFSDTNKRAYERPYIGSPTAVLYADHLTSTYPKMHLYETMSDIDTGVGGLRDRFGYLTGTIPVKWRFFASVSSMIFCFNENPTHGSWNMLWVIDFNSFEPGDNWNTCTKGYYTTSATAADRSDELSSVTNLEIIRSSATGDAIAATGTSNKASKTSQFGYDHLSFIDEYGNINIAEVALWEGTTKLRGVLSNIYDVVGSRSAEIDTFMENIEQLPGKTLYFQYVGDDFGSAIDIVGPWDE